LYNPDTVASDSVLACDSGGFYWIWRPHMKTRNISRVADLGFTGPAIDKVNKLVNGGSFGYFERFAFSWYVRSILTDWIPESSEMVVETPRRVSIRINLLRPE
jgi:predicted chitinase